MSAPLRSSAAGIVAQLQAAGVTRGDRVGLAVSPDGTSGLAVGADAPDAGSGRFWLPADQVAGVAEVERQLRPRWTWWSNATPAVLLPRQIRVSTCFDVAAVHRLLLGGVRADPATVWAYWTGLGSGPLPSSGQLDLLAAASSDGEGGDVEDPVRPDGHLRPEWTSGGWHRSGPRLARWAGLALQAAQRQQPRLVELGAADTALSESTAELLCAELSFDGVPFDLDEARRLIADAVGPEPSDADDARRSRLERDEQVLRHVGVEADLRNPAQVKQLLASVGIDVPDTRSWRLERFVGAHPVVQALLTWRRAERIATTYGYSWLAATVGADSRLRGSWSGSDGAAGRMTATAGLHNMPAEFRPAVRARPGSMLVVADLGQIEPRVLAAVSQDPALVRATADADLYAPIAARLSVERPVAKVAMLAAMYGQTSGAAGQTLKAMESAYPVALRLLTRAYEDGRAGRDVRTHGGRLVRMPRLPDTDPDSLRAATGARGRYARNAVIQGAAAEFFKLWAVLVRARLSPLSARIVLCLHDELVVEVPATDADRAAAVLRDCLADAARRWSPAPDVRFVCDLDVVQDWSHAG